jgi:hypothetical protein
MFPMFVYLGLGIYNGLGCCSLYSLSTLQQSTPRNKVLQGPVCRYVIRTESDHTTAFSKSRSRQRAE